MSKPKVKDEVETKKKKSLTILGEQNAEVDIEPESLWEEEVQALIGQKFNSLVDVIDAIAERVCLRLGETEDPNLHEFIVMMLDTDEEIRAELKSLFNLE